MRVILLMLSIAILATACTGDPAAYSQNLGATAEAAVATATAAGQATATASAIAAEGTRQAEEARIATATIGAAQTKQVSDYEIAMLSAQVQASQEAVANVLTLAAVTRVAVQETQAAAYEATARPPTETAAARATGTSAAITDVPLQATIAAGKRAEWDAINAESRKRIKSWTWTLFWPFLFFSLVAVGVRAAFSYFKNRDLRVEYELIWEDRRNSITNANNGVYLWVEDDDGRMRPVLQPKEARLPILDMNAGTYGPRAPYAASAADAFEPPEEEEPAERILEETINLLERAAKWFGEDLAVIPRYKKLGWSRVRRDRVVAALEKAKAVRVEENKGSYILPPYNTIGGLLSFIDGGQLREKLRPTPPPQKPFEPGE